MVGRVVDDIQGDHRTQTDKDRAAVFGDFDRHGLSSLIALAIVPVVEPFTLWKNDLTAWFVARHDTDKQCVTEQIFVFSRPQMHQLSFTKARLNVLGIEEWHQFLM